MFCSNCGNKIEDGAAFCSNCGTPVESEEPIKIQPNPAKKKFKGIWVLGLICVCILGVVAVVLPKLVSNISLQRETKKTEDAIEEAFAKITDTEEFSCFIEVNASIYTSVNGTQLHGGYSANADTTFKNNRVHLENGRDYDLISSDTDILHIEDIAFETFVTEYHQTYMKKDEGDFERIDGDFTKDDVLTLFDEVIANYNEKMTNYKEDADSSREPYTASEDSDTITIDGTISDGTEVYNTYIAFLEVSSEEPENAALSCSVDYSLSISKENQTLQSITFYLPDVEHIWLGWGNDGLQVNGSSGELTIEFRSFTDIEDFDLPSVASDSVEDFNNNEDIDWLSAYMDYVENGNFDSDAYCGYSFIYLDNDEIPELVIHGSYVAAGNIICSYYNGLISELQTASFSYLEKQGLLCNSDGNMGYYYDIVYSLENGEFTKIAEGNYGDDGDYWNGEQVTADEYHNALAQVYNEENAIYDSENYSSISEAYENINTTTSKSDDSISSTEIPNGADSSVGDDIPDGTKPAFDDNTISSESWYYICGYHDDEDPYPFITQELIDTQEDKVATYPSELYHSTSRELEYKDGILTIKYNNSSYKFQIYFTDDGELISDIVYIE